MNLWWLIAGVCGCLLILELSLRWFGFGNPLIYIAEEEIGYLLAPSQRTKRMGNRIEINQYSMRSQEISLSRPPSTLRVLLLGDSVANGAWWTDQDQTISALIETQLQLLPSSDLDKYLLSGLSFKRQEVLNASANSWGPRNQLAYLKRLGTFEAQFIVLLINTDDLFATAPTSLPVGRDSNYPTHKPPLAFIEVFQRYIFTAPQISVVNEKPPEQDPVGCNEDAIRQINQICLAADAKFILVMTPLLREIGQPGSRDYEIKARLRLAEFTQDQQITYLDLLEAFNNSPTPTLLYRDHIHLSPQGNQKVTEAITPSLQFFLPQISSSASTTPPRPQ